MILLQVLTTQLIFFINLFEITDTALISIKPFLQYTHRNPLLSKRDKCLIMVGRRCFSTSKKNTTDDIVNFIKKSKDKVNELKEAVVKSKTKTKKPSTSSGSNSFLNLQIDFSVSSFISGILYLTPTDPSSRTVFFRGFGDRGFVFTNTHKETETGQFNAEKWISPEPDAGDMILFPSYLLHAVPLNQGDMRVSMAFNAIPERLQAWGYGISFAK